MKLSALASTPLSAALAEGLFAELTCHKLGMANPKTYANGLQGDLQDEEKDTVKGLAKFYNIKVDVLQNPAHAMLQLQMASVKSEKGSKATAVPTAKPGDGAGGVQPIGEQPAEQTAEQPAEQPAELSGNGAGQNIEEGDVVQVSAVKQKVLYDGQQGEVVRVLAQKFRVNLLGRQETKDFDKSRCKLVKKKMASSAEAVPGQETPKGETSLRALFGKDVVE